MKAVAGIIMVIGIVSLVAAVVSRLTMTPIAVVPGGLEADALLTFTNTCLLISIIIMMGEMGKK